MIKVLFAAAEMYPLIKTGGLADVAGALPTALAAAGADVRVALPAYRGLLDRLEGRRRVANLSIRDQPFFVWEGRVGNSAPVWLLDCPALYDRPGDPYRDENGREWGDNAWRFGCYSEAVARLALGAGGSGFRADVLHANDWQAALALPWVRELTRNRDGAPITLIYSIHNLAYAGFFPGEQAMYLGLPGDWWNGEGVEFNGSLCFMKGGIHYADAITTVSPTYAREIQQPGADHGFDVLLRARGERVFGIVNGIDDVVWNPATDPYIDTRYDERSFLEGKRANKRALQGEFGLAAEGDSLLIGMISRFAGQKGIDLVLDAAEALMERPLQLVLLGSGDADIEARTRALAAAYPGRVGLRVGYDERLAHRIEAGADAFLMPSRYEPCGLNQMYSQHYGTVPIARRTGGLVDTIVDADVDVVDSGAATGVLFEGLDGAAVIVAVDRALDLRSDPQRWWQIGNAGMRRDFSWRQVASRYMALYETATG